MEAKAIVEDLAKDARTLRAQMHEPTWDPRQQSLPMLKPLKSPCRLDLEWWAVQGSNL